MHPLMIVLLAQMNRPFVAVSKPMLQAWARFRRFKLPRMARMLASESGKVAGAEAESKATELREEAAAKFKEAHDFMEGCCKTAGVTMDDLKDDESKISAEDLASFDVLMEDGQRLRAEYEVAAKTEGRYEGLRESMDYFHGKATGKPLPWNQVTEHQIERKSLGQQFVTSETYLELVAKGDLHSDGAHFATDRITAMGLLSEVVGLQKDAQAGDAKAFTQLEEMKAASDLIQSESGGPGAALVTPQYLAGILNLPQRPLAIRELFASGPATSDSISYAAQSEFDSGAATVAQAETVSGGVKPQSSITWERKTSPIETIATYMAATRQQLADAGQVASLIDNQGRLMLQLEEEDQLLSGNGATPNLKGVLNESGVQTLAVAAGADADAAGLLNLKSIRTAKRMTMTGVARMAADGVVMHPADSEEFDLLTDGNGLFRGGNPVGNFTFGQSIWALPRVESEAISEGTVLVGAFKGGATVLERMPITVFTTDSHSDWFTKNIIAVLFEERLGFPIFRPAAFVKITLNLWEGGT